jgi:mannose-6-phosphate isomerase-like protein (cupin superfamily)
MKIVNRSTSKPISTPHGTFITPLIDRSTSEITECSLAEELLPPGMAVQPHFHKTHEEIYYLITGRGRMRVADEWQDVSAGDAVYIPVNAVHSLENTGGEDMRLVVVVGPAFSFDDVFQSPE